MIMRKETNSIATMLINAYHQPSMRVTRIETKRKTIMRNENMPSKDQRTIRTSEQKDTNEHPKRPAPRIAPSNHVAPSSLVRLASLNLLVARAVRRLLVSTLGMLSPATMLVLRLIAIVIVIVVESSS
jgi:hypothetical protein